MIQYAKKILPKVSAWEFLFRKELLKIYNWIPENEMMEFKTWCFANFQHNYADILNEIFVGTNEENKRIGKAG